MKDQFVFKRYELKYLITEEQKKFIVEAMEPYMEADAHGRSTISNVYYDTPDFLLARRSIEKPVFKEKLRMRSYGTANADSKIFVELKRKSESVVYKRRISMREPEAKRWMERGVRAVDSEEAQKQGQMIRELEYFRQMYKGLGPAVYLSYEREAFYSKEDSGFRVTFDENILWRDYDLSLCKGPGGEAILPPGTVLMEIKTGTAIPLWMTALLTENHIYKTSFSKYGRAYQTKYLREREGCSIEKKTDRKHISGGNYA